MAVQDGRSAGRVRVQAKGRQADRGAQPPRPPKRPKSLRPSAVETRFRIVRTARQVFSEVGYDATTFHDIATRAGITRPAVNYYFATKQVLFREVVESTTAILSAGVDNAFAARTLAGQLSAFVDAIMAASAEDRSTMALLVTSVLESQRHPELPSDALAASRAFLTWAVDGAIERRELAENTDAAALVETLVALVWGIGFYAGFLGGAEHPAVMTEQFQLLVSGMLLPELRQSRCLPASPGGTPRQRLARGSRERLRGQDRLGRNTRAPH